ncbi:MAG: ABC transporter ATP-binding protein, partial [Alphaproteobacteria bacterium]|nr:ABC transporter ATP-binding protein [Alphaproteobacteria bacterium]
MTKTLLKINNLSVSFKMPDKAADFEAVKSISFSISRGKTVALVGESGSGKSVTALSVMQLLPYPMASHDKKSSIIFEDEELIGKNSAFMRRLRGHKIGMIFQEPQTALNPLHTVEKQIGEVLKLHQGMDDKQTRARVLELLDMVGLPQLKDRMNAYPHELSGGQRQRVMIAMALANNPDLLIADEPTTALDVTVQAQILELLQDLQNKLGMALLLITHDLSIVEKMADYVCVMQNGEIVEQKEAKALFANPQHEYTKMLLNTIPRGTVPAFEADAPVLFEGRGIKVHFPQDFGFFGKPKSFVKAVDMVDITIHRGETLGVVGESGSGKSTLGYAALRLLDGQGRLLFDGADISTYRKKQMRPLRSRMQIVFQDPFSSLSPRMSIAQIIEEGLKLHRKGLNAEKRDALVVKALKDVNMDPETRHRYPHEFSGGQRQRVAIARAIVLAPELVVLDEPTSALDVSVQAQIVDLLRTLQKKHGLSYMFISHDLRVVRAMSHSLVVMKDGHVIEHGSAVEIFANPREEYTKAL